MHVRRILTYASFIVFVAAAWFLHRELAELGLAEILDELRASSGARIAVAAAFTIGSYLTLTAYDALAVRYVGKAVPYVRTALTSFMAFAVGNNIGIATLAAGPIRYRMYSVLGLSGVEIAKVLLFCTSTFALGAACLLGAALWVVPVQELGDMGISVMLARVAGTLMLAAGIGYLALPVFRLQSIRLRNWRIDLPGPRIRTAQLVFSVLDLVFTAATLYVLIAPDLDVSFVTFLSVYLIAISAGILSNVPGGIGVFEAIFLLAFPDVGRDVLLGKIVLYRLIYYIGPLLLALVIMAAHELILHRKPIQAVGARLADALSSIAPQVMGAAVFLAGLVLLVSGASPGVESRLRMISRFLPHAVLELSHLAGSLIGLCLLVLARGLYRRLRGAYRVVGMLLLAGAVASLLKGLDYEEAIILFGAFGMLWVTRDEFHRQGSLLDQRFPGHWVAVILIALAGTAWVGIASYRHIPYSTELWWQFSLDGDAPRMLRAMLLVSVAAIAFVVSRLIRPVPPRVQPVTSEDMESVRRILDGAAWATANAALIGDKRFLFNESRTAFIMYQVSGRSWVALGDPVGPGGEREALSWQFRELCDRFDGWPVFYQVSDAALPIYIDMGLTLSKLGEEGLVPLEHFSLEGRERADFRQARNRAQRDGADFAVVPRSEVPAIVPALKAISDAWLEHKGAAEKGFSLGRFTPEYVTQFDCAVVRVAGEIVAFANLWQAPAGRELSIDLMRYGENAPKSVMDYLFAELMLWARDRGFAWFNLGMAPLSGLESNPLAPLWHRVGGLIFRHADDFYNFEGLRHYKEKFAPVWRPHYLASPGGLALPRVILDSSILISGGLTKIVSR
jgi:phosphatidylglycerol lysyltransferase